ncbi:MAG TPA: hypothetical protein GXX72_05765 [Clostridiaceae bacterium]|nr:hypothetical protein [Clostridiaceae bacterium]
MAERSIGLDNIKDTIINPLKIKDSKLRYGGEPSFTEIGKECAIAVNPKTGKIITIHRTHYDVVKKLKGER